MLRSSEMICLRILVVLGVILFSNTSGHLKEKMF